MALPYTNNTPRYKNKTKNELNEMNGRERELEIQNE
jgi:hypothetical protein